MSFFTEISCSFRLCPRCWLFTANNQDVGACRHKDDRVSQLSRFEELVWRLCEVIWWKSLLLIKDGVACWLEDSLIPVHSVAPGLIGLAWCSDLSICLVAVSICAEAVPTISEYSNFVSRISNIMHAVLVVSPPISGQASPARVESAQQMKYVYRIIAMPLPVTNTL